MKNKKNTKYLGIFFGVIILASFIMRLVPHPANFVPMGALALFSGIYFRSKWAILVPAAVMVTSDLIIGLHSLILFTWGSFMLFGMIGWWVRKNKHLIRIASGTLMGSVLFFIITNFAVWAFTPLYSKTAVGLVQCFYMALPFFRSSLLGDLFYVGIFIGTYEIVKYLVLIYQKKRLVPVKNN